MRVLIPTLGRLGVLLLVLVLVLPASEVFAGPVLHFRADLSDEATPGSLPFFVGDRSGLDDTDPPVAGSIDELLQRDGIDLNDPDFETTASSFLIPQNTSSLQFTLVEDTGAFVFKFFYFVVDQAIGDPGSAQWRQTAIENSVLIFDDVDSSPGVNDTRTFSVSDSNTGGSMANEISEGSELGFILQPRGNFGNSVENFGNFLFSDSRGNPDIDLDGSGDDQLLAFTGTPELDSDLTLFAFEDVAAVGSDRDYTDLVFTITPALIPVVVAEVPAPASMYLLAFGSVLLLGRRPRPGADRI
ncbi:MAG: DUF4114 domain-containing protein [Pseudomonadota bacterium]